MVKTIFFYVALLCVLCIPIGSAEVLIEQIMYDPFGPDDGKEFIDIRNYGDAPVRINDLSLHAGRLSFVFVWSGEDCTMCFLLPNESLRVVAYRLHNTAGSVLLNSSNGTLDLVGYGDAEFYQGTPVPRIPEGSSLYRINNTKNNSLDFIRSHERNDSFSDKLYAEIFVRNVAPVLHSAELFKQDDSFFIIANATDDNGLSDITHFVYYFGNTLYEDMLFGNDDFSVETSSSGMIPFNNGISEVQLQGPVSEMSLAVIDSSQSLSNVLLLPVFTYLFNISSISSVSLAPGEDALLDIVLQAGKDATYELNLGSLYGREEIVLNKTKTAFLFAGDEHTFSIEIALPKGIPKGSYKGLLEVVIKQ